MIAWLWNLIVGQFCRHKWEERGHCSRVNEEGKKTGDDFYLRCTNCGEMKSKKL